MNKASGFPTTINGALRYIDAAAIRRGLAAVKEHKSLSLGMKIIHGAGPIAPLRTPAQHFMRRDGGDYCTGARSEVGGFGFSDDVIMLSTHGTTHIDALCHVFSDGLMFGDIPATEVSSYGARHLGAETIPPIVTRVLIIDAVPEDQDWLMPGQSVTAERLRALIDDAGFSVEPGDALFVRTGSLRAYLAGKQHDRSWPGLAADCAEWISESRISVVGADNMAVEVVPSETPDMATPLHTKLMRGEGVMFVELLDLEEFAGRNIEAMLTISPLRIVGGTASPVAPTILY